MAIIGGIDLGNLTDYLLFFADARDDANWQGATKGFAGDVAVDGIQADERTSGDVPYAGTIFTNDSTLDAWQDIVDQNDPPDVDPAQAFASTGNTTLISDLEATLDQAFLDINALTVTDTVTDPEDAAGSGGLDGWDSSSGGAQDGGPNDIFVIDVTGGLSVSSQIDITGDPGDVFILRWDDDSNLSNGYDGQVKFQSGGGIVPLGGLAPSNFIHVAGDIKASGGGSNPASPYPQGPRYDDGTGTLITDGEDFDGGGFFTGYWLTTGNPDKNFETSSLDNAIFVGGWYTSSTKFSLTSGSSGVYVSPNADSLTPLTLVGGNDDDLLNGGTGDEELRGNLGNDILIGGQGSDTFIFASGDGTDTIIDFNDGTDLIGLDGGLGFGDLSFSSSDIILTSTNEVLATLTGVDTTTLTSADFVMLY